MSRIRKKVLADGKTRWYPLTTVDGKETPLGGFRTKTNAQAALKKAEAEVASGTYGMKASMTFSELSETWLESVRLDVKPATYSDYAIQVRVHLVPYFGKMKIDAITRADVDGYRSAKASEVKRVKRLNEETGKREWVEVPYSTRRTNKALTVLGSIFRYAVEREYLERSPTRFMKKIKEDRHEMAFLNPEEINRLLDACSPDFYPICFTAIMTGLRQGELFGLKWSDVSFAEKVIHVRRTYHPTHGFGSPKSRKGERVVVMSPALADVLAGHKAKTGGGTDDLVFRNKDGKVIDYRNLRLSEYNKALDRAGLRRIRFHDLRHTHAALMIANPKVNVKLLQRQMGHADIGVTLNTYGHLLPDASEGVGEALDEMVCPGGVRWPMEGLVRVK